MWLHVFFIDTFLKSVRGGTGFRWGSFSSAWKCVCREQRTGSILPNFSCSQRRAVQSCTLSHWINVPVLTTLVACTGQQLNMQSSEGHIVEQKQSPFYSHPTVSSWAFGCSPKGKRSPVLGKVSLCLHPNTPRSSTSAVAPPWRLPCNTAGRKSC